MVLAGHELLYDLLSFVEVKTVAAGFADAYIEPDRRVETGLLSEHQLGQLKSKILAVFRGFEILSCYAPISNGVDDPMHKLSNTGFSIGRTHAAMKILADHNIGRSLRPIGRYHYVALLEDDRTLIVAD